MFEGFGGGLGAGMLGLGVASDAFGAYSAYQQQQRQRELYKQQMDLAAKQRDPGYMIGQAQPYYQANMAALRAALPSLERSSINPEIGMRGISGGAAQSLYDQVVGQQQQQAWGNAMNQAQGGMGGSMSALQNAGGNVGQSQGGVGGTASALQALMLMQALRGGGQQNPSQASSGMAVSPVGGSSGRTDMDFNPLTAGADQISNPLSYQFTPQSFGSGF